MSKQRQPTRTKHEGPLRFGQGLREGFGEIRTVSGQPITLGDPKQPRQAYWPAFVGFANYTFTDEDLARHQNGLYLAAADVLGCLKCTGQCRTTNGGGLYYGFSRRLLDAQLRPGEERPETFQPEFAMQQCPGWRERREQLQSLLRVRAWEGSG